MIDKQFETEFCEFEIILKSEAAARAVYDKLNELQVSDERIIIQTP